MANFCLTAIMYPLKLVRKWSNALLSATFTFSCLHTGNSTDELAQVCAGDCLCMCKGSKFAACTGAAFAAIENHSCCITNWQSATSCCLPSPAINHKSKNWHNAWWCLDWSWPNGRSCSDLFSGQMASPCWFCRLFSVYQLKVGSYVAFYLVVDILTIKCAPLFHVNIHLTYRLYGMKVLLWSILYLSWCAHDDMVTWFWDWLFLQAQTSTSIYGGL